MKRNLLLFMGMLMSVFIIASCSVQKGKKKKIPSGSYTLNEIPDIPYRNDSLQCEQTKLNLVLPKGINNPPALIWIGQGAWAYVDRNVEMNICRAIAREGIAVVSAGHRLSPALLWGEKREEGIQHPEHIKDIALAFKWVYEHAEKYGYSKENIFVGGFSSGAHLSALLAMDNRYLDELGLSNRMIKGIIPVGGGFDIPHYKKVLIEEDASYEDNHINPVFGKTNEEHINASPVTFIDSLITPILLISEGDTYIYNEVFEAALVEKGYKQFRTVNFHDDTHGGLWRKLGDEEECICRDIIVNYVLSLSKFSK